MFNFYVTPSPVFEMHDGTGKWFGKFKNLAYGVPYAWNDPRGKIPREICDAGLAVVPDRLADFKSDTSRIIMEVTIANMLSAVQEYRETHAKFLEKYVDLRFFFRTKKEFEEHQRRLRQLGAKAKPGPILGLHAGVIKKRKAATIDDKVN
ncbi:hypothetical protein KY311_03590, partial [Candidatus Woesearchaeota archaeon]|nr:hypothetical protein [Candidatus Woesearchaeota archaeon]